MWILMKRWCFIYLFLPKHFCLTSMYKINVHPALVNLNNYVTLVLTNLNIVHYILEITGTCSYGIRRSVGQRHFLRIY